MDKSKLLWIHGGPGFGKTILFARIIEYLTAKSSHPLVYFFCVADEEARREPYAVLRSWIDQLVQGNIDALDIAFDMYKANQLRSPTSLELWKLFTTLAQAIVCTFVVDGFDECTTINKSSRYHTTDGRSEFLGSLIKASKEAKARILFVSRDNEDIRS
jgi:NACHT domain